MSMSRRFEDRFEYLAVTRERWPDMQKLFEASANEDLGNPSRCWCMEMRLRDHDVWREQCQSGGEGNRKAMQALIESGAALGILAYEGGEAIGWCSVSPREQLVGLPEPFRSGGTSTPEVWAITCFYVPETQRGMGLMKGLLGAAVQFAIEAGAQIVEGYPMIAEFVGDGAEGSVPIFEAAGFVEVGRVNEVQRVMHYVVQH
jgi:GNAT superfamily N-acetyltransferase